jgi:acylphosphatase
MLQTFSITVNGKVQGVFYRQSTLQKAQELGITGTVKNLPNGDVFIMATGTPDQLQQLISWCKQGPTRAQVSSVWHEEVALQTFTGFAVIR